MQHHYKCQLEFTTPCICCITIYVPNPSCSCQMKYSQTLVCDIIAQL